LISCFPGLLLRYFLNGFEMVPVAHNITGLLLPLSSSHVLNTVQLVLNVNGPEVLYLDK
jgi:hypothetical protein